MPELHPTTQSSFFSLIACSKAASGDAKQRQISATHQRHSY